MPDITCKLLQTINLARLFKITPIAIGRGVVTLRIVPCDNPPLRARYFLQTCDEVLAKRDAGPDKFPGNEMIIVDFPGAGSEVLN